MPRQGICHTAVRAKRYRPRLSLPPLPHPDGTHPPAGSPAPGAWETAGSGAAQPTTPPPPALPPGSPLSPHAAPAGAPWRPEAFATGAGGATTSSEAAAHEALRKARTALGWAIGAAVGAGLALLATLVALVMWFLPGQDPMAYPVWGHIDRTTPVWASMARP